MSSEQIADLAVKLGADLSGWKKGLEGGNSAADSFEGHTGNVFAKIGGAFAALGVTAAATKFFTGAITEARQAEKTTADTRNTLQTTGASAWETAGKVDDLATSLSNYSATNQDVIHHGENLLLSFSNVKNAGIGTNAVFDRASKVAVDLSAKWGMALPASMKVVGKALQDPEHGMTALTKVGAGLSEQQKDLVKHLAATGDTLGEQKVILDALESKVGGTAGAIADPWDKLRVTWENIQRTVGEKLLPVLNQVATLAAAKLPQAIKFATDEFHLFQGILVTVADKLDFLRPIAEKVGSFLGDHLQAIVAGLTGAMAVLAGIAGIGAVIEALGVVVAVIASPITLIAALAAGLVIAWQESSTFRDVVKGAMSIARDAFTGVRDAVAAIGSAVKDAVGDVENSRLSDDLAGIGDRASKGFDKAKKALGGLVDDVASGLKSPTQKSLIDQVMGMQGGFDVKKQTGMGELRSAFATGWDDIKNDSGGAWASLQNDAALGTAGILQKVLDFAPNLKGDFANTWDDVQKTAHDGAHGVSQAFDDLVSGQKTLPQFLGDIARNAMQISKDAFSVGMDQIKIIWDIDWSGLRDKASEIWNDISSNIGQKIGEILNTLRGWALRADDAVGDTHHVLLHKGIDLIQGLLDGISSMFGWVIGFFESLPGRIEGAIRNPRAFLYGVGQAIIDGLIGGIESMVQSAVNTVTSVLGRIVDRAKSFLGIHSPSTVFHEIGQNIGTGLTLGISSKHSDVRGALAGLLGGSGASIDLSPLVTGGGSQTVHHVITVNHQGEMKVSGGAIDYRDFADKAARSMRDALLGLGNFGTILGGR